MGLQPSQDAAAALMTSREHEQAVVAREALPALPSMCSARIGADVAALRGDRLVPQSPHAAAPVSDLPQAAA